MSSTISELVISCPIRFCQPLIRGCHTTCQVSVTDFSDEEKVLELLTQREERGRREVNGESGGLD